MPSSWQARRKSERPGRSSEISLRITASLATASPQAASLATHLSGPRNRSGLLRKLRPLNEYKQSADFG